MLQKKLHSNLPASDDGHEAVSSFLGDGPREPSSSPRKRLQASGQ